MSDDDRALLKSIALTRPTVYKIWYRDLNGNRGCFNGEFDEAHARIWMAYLRRPENALGVDYWPEPPLPETEAA